MPRAGLSTDRVVTEAGILVDESELTLAALAARLGVQPPSLYKHVSGLDSLNQLIAVRAKNDLADALAAASSDAEVPLIAVARAYRTWAHAHPGQYTATLRAPHPDDAADVEASTLAIGVIIVAIARYGLGDADVIDATRAIRSALHGFVTLEAAGAFEMPQSVDESFDTMVRELVATVERWGSA